MAKFVQWASDCGVKIQTQMYQTPKITESCIKMSPDPSEKDLFSR